LTCRIGELAERLGFERAKQPHLDADVTGVVVLEMDAGERAHAVKLASRPGTFGYRVAQRID
jgi:hypothetical protein